MLSWWRGDWPDREPGSPPRDIGGATDRGLRRYAASGDPRAAGAGAGNAGNGSLMRCLPTALAVADRDRRIRESMEISAITHDDPRCTVACAAYNEIAAALLAGAEPAEAVEIGQSVARLLDSTEVAEAVSFGRHISPAVAAHSGQNYVEASGYVLDSLTLAIAALLDPRPFPDVVIDIVRIGHDTDTNGAIAGGLLGLRDGAAAIPSAWVAKLQFAEEFGRAAEVLAAR